MAGNMIESFFQRSLEDMVKGLRMQMIGETAYLSKALEESRKEMKSMDQSTKAVALQKLTYLNMLQGTDMGWAAFQVVEVMSMQKFSSKKIGYLAASQSFNESTDVLLLITNLLRKDFNGKNEFETSLAIECLSRLATADLARDLMPEIFTMLASNRAFIRKKAMASLWRVFSQYPDGIRVAFKRLVEGLSDHDPSVVNAAISVLCDLAMKDPRPYLPLAPELYKLLLSSPNNWLCIKLVKILGVLAPLEPRLVKKIAEPLCELMRKSDAKSLLLECIQTVTTGLTQHSGAVELSVEKLQDLMKEDDTNLRYLCLRALGNLMELHPWAVAANKEAIISCLSHRDPGIQRGALRLIIGMVSEDNVIATVRILLQHAYSSQPESCNDLVSAVLASCSSDNYAVVPDFSWYVSVLAEMARIPQCECGDEIGRQLIDIGFRVESAKGEVFRAGRGLLADPALLEKASVHGLLSAAAWMVGEYVGFSTNSYELLESLLQPRTRLLPPSARAVYLQAVFKVFVHSSSKFFGTKELPNGDPGMGFVGGNVSGTVDTRSEWREELTSEDFTEADLANPSARDPEFMEESLGREAGQGEHSEWEQSQARQRGKQGANDWQHESVQNYGEEIPENHVEEEPQCALESIEPTLQLISENVAVLVTSLDVEVQERACNLSGLLHLVKDMSPLRSSKQRESLEVQDSMEALEALLGVLTVQLSPVSVHAQGRVTAPEGLILENLDTLGPMHSSQEAVGGVNGRVDLPEWEIGKLPLFQGKGSTSQVDGSASLLAQHRQRHQSFYLPTEVKSGANSFGYPPPLDPAAQGSYSPTTRSGPLHDDDASWSTRPARPKVRPVVVKLDDEEDPSKSSTKFKKKDLKDEFISSAIMDVLAGSSRSVNKFQPTPQGPEGRESTRAHQHRSHGSRSSKRLARQSSSNRQTPSAGKDRSAVEQGATPALEMDGKPSKRLEHIKSTGRHKHQSRALSSSQDVED